MKVIFSWNGNTIAFSNRGQQVPPLQQSWLLLYVDFLVSKGIDPQTITFELPNGKKAKVFKIEDGFNWEIK